MKLRPQTSGDVYQTTPVGWVTLPPGMVCMGAKTDQGVVASERSDKAWVVTKKGGGLAGGKDKLQILPTK